MNNNLEFENETPSPDSIEDNHPRTNYGEGYGGKETLEEAAENYGNSIGNKNGTAQFDFIRGAKWQAERMYSKYSKEDLISFAHFFFKEEFNSTMQTSKSTDEIFKEWFEQNKKNVS